jgi:hypothetical protein
MLHGPGSTYDFQMEETLRKHKIGRTMVFVHQPNTPVNKYEKLLVGKMDINWEVVALENFVNFLERQNDLGRILTAKPDMPEPDPEAVKDMKAKGITVE